MAAAAAESRWEERKCMGRAEAQTEQDRAAFLARHEFELAKASVCPSRGQIRWPPIPAHFFCIMADFNAAEHPLAISHMSWWHADTE